MTRPRYLVTLMPTASAARRHERARRAAGRVPIPGISMPPNHRFSTYRLSQAAAASRSFPLSLFLSLFFSFSLSRPRVPFGLPRPLTGHYTTVPSDRARTGSNGEPALRLSSPHAMLSCAALPICARAGERAVPMTGNVRSAGGTSVEPPVSSLSIVRASRARV